MTEIYVAGVGMTTFGKHESRTMRSLAEEAVADALADAGGSVEEVEYAFFANATAALITGQACIPGQSALRHTGMLGIPMVNVENACASGSSAFGLARAMLASGAADVAIAVGAEKLTHPDKAKSFAAFSAGYDQEEPPSAAQQSGSTGTVFMDIYAQLTRDYMARSGATEDDFAAVAVKAHDHGRLNPKAQYGDPVTLQQVLDSRMISDPLRLLMCSPISDGAAALVLATARGLQRLDADPVRILATALVSGRDRLDGDRTAVQRAAGAAYQEAGIGVGDVDVVELHDAAAPAELIVTEELGLCAPGEGPHLLRSGVTALGGKTPVNPSGGLLSKGHPVGATGCAQLVELTDQVRGRCGSRQVDSARIALAENGGGFLENDAAAATVTILAR